MKITKQTARGNRAGDGGGCECSRSGATGHQSGTTGYHWGPTQRRRGVTQASCRHRTLTSVITVRQAFFKNTASAVRQHLRSSPERTSVARRLRLGNARCALHPLPHCHSFVSRLIWGVDGQFRRLPLITHAAIEASYGGAK